jgi:hypothetical protein
MNEISSHPDNDRWSLYEFSRTSGLPIGYFDGYWTPDRCVFWASVAGIVAATIIVGVTACSI